MAVPLTHVSYRRIEKTAPAYIWLIHTAQSNTKYKKKKKTRG